MDATTMHLTCWSSAAPATLGTRLQQVGELRNTMCCVHVHAHNLSPGHTSNLLLATSPRHSFTAAASPLACASQHTASIPSPLPHSRASQHEPPHWLSPQRRRAAGARRGGGGAARAPGGAGAPADAPTLGAGAAAVPGGAEPAALHTGGVQRDHRPRAAGGGPGARARGAAQGQSWRAAGLMMLRGPGRAGGTARHSAARARSFTRATHPSTPTSTPRARSPATRSASSPAARCPTPPVSSLAQRCAAPRVCARCCPHARHAQIPPTSPRHARAHPPAAPSPPLPVIANPLGPGQLPGDWIPVILDVLISQPACRMQLALTGGLGYRP